MSLSSLGCSLRVADVDKKLAETGIDPSRRTDIENRIKQLDVLLSATASGQKAERAAAEASIRATILENMKRAGEMVRVGVLAPDRARGFEQFLVHDLGVARRWLGLGNSYSEGGWVRESMNRSRRLWAGGLEKNLRDLGAVEKARTLYEPLRKELKQLGIDDADLDYVFTTAYEQGWHPQIMRYAPPGQQGQKILAGREANFLDHMVKELGVPPETAQRIMDAGRKIAEVQHDVGMLASNAGVQFNRESFLAQLPRIASDEAKMRFNWRYDDLKSGKIQFDDGSVDTIQNILGRSQVSYEFGVEDEVLLDFVLRQVSVAKYGSPQALFENATGVSGAGIADILDSSGAVSRSLLDLEGDTLDSLVDTGLLSKIPLPAVDIVNNLKLKYDFPFEGLAEVFAVDWSRGMKIYELQLQRLAHKSGFVNQLVTQAIDGNWGVPKSVIEADPKAYAGFVPLVTPTGSQVPGVLPQSLLDRMGYRSTRQREMGLMLENTYVHPTVAKLAKANIDLQLSPQAMGVVGRFSHTIGKTFRNLAVATLEYVPKQFWNTIAAQHAGEGNILLVPHYAYKLAQSQLSGRDMAEFLDDAVAKFRLSSGDMLTEKGLWEHLRSVGYLSDYEPMTGGVINPGGYHHSWDGKTVERNMRYLQNTFSQFGGTRRVLDELSYGTAAALERATYPLKWANNWLDNAGRFAGIVSTVSPPGINDGIRAITTQAIRKHRTVEEGLEHWGNFYFQYDDVTYADRILSNHVIPFWGFHSKNIPAAVRFVAQHPTRFMAYQRLYALANRPVQQEDNSQLTESTVPPWMLQSRTIFFGNKDSGYFGVPMGGLDPIASGLEMVTKPVEAISEMFGIAANARTRSTGERIDNLPWNEGTKTNAAISALLDNTFPMYSAAVQTVNNRDQYSRPLDQAGKITSFLGYETSPSFRLWAESLLPILGTINRINPGNRFGTPAIRDSRTGTWQAGTPSQMPFSGGTPRSDKDNFQTNNPYRQYSAIGVKIYPIDVWLNAGYSYDSLRANIGAAGKFRSQLVDGLEQLQPGTPKYLERVQQIQEVDYLLSETRNQMNALDDWAASEGINVKQAVGKLNAANRRIGDLPNANGQ